MEPTEKQWRIGFFFDFVSPYSYLAFHRIGEIAAHSGCAVDYQAVDLAELKRRAGNTGPATRQIPVKLRYARTDIERWARRYGVTLVSPTSNRPMRANRGLALARREGRTMAYMTSAWAHGWRLGQDLSEDATLRAIADESGIHSDRLLAWVDSEEAIEILAAATDAAANAGLFGVPTMTCGDEMWWGNDRLDFLQEHLAVQAVSVAR